MNDSHFDAGNELRELAPRIVEYADRLQADRAAAQAVSASPAPALKTPRDTVLNVDFVSSSVWAGEQLLFDDYVAWSKILYTNRGERPSQLTEDLIDIRTAIDALASAESAAAAHAMIDSGLGGLETYPLSVDTFIEPGHAFGTLGFAYLKAALAGDKRSAGRIVLDAVQGGVPIPDIYEYFFEATQRELGRMWQSNVINVAQEHLATEVTRSVMGQLYPQVNTLEKGPHTVVTAVVEAEFHGIGAQIVADFFEMNHWESFYLGPNTPLAPMLKTVAQVDADVLALSATMTRNLPYIAEVISALRADPEIAHVCVLVGGYPFNIAPDLWRTVGANGYARTAREAIAVADRLTSTPSTT